MHILIIAQHFPPERGAVRRLFDFSRYFVQHGHEVSVLTAIPSYPDGIVPEPYRHHFLYYEEIDGVRIYRSWVLPASNRNRVKRMIGFTTFCLTSLINACRVKSKPDLVLASMPPVNTPVIGWLLSRLWRTPFIFEVRDLEPEVCEQLNNLKPSMFTRMIKRMVHCLYRRADKLVAVTDGLAESLLALGNSPEKIAVIKSGFGAEFLSADDGNIRHKFGWEGKFLILYAGTLGRMHVLNTVIGAARHLRDHPDIRFVFVGDGETRPALESMVRDWSLSNVDFLGTQPLEDVPLFLRASDVLVECLADVPLAQGAFPSKLFEYMASGRPILFGARGGEAIRELNAAGGVLSFASDDVGTLSDLILQIKNKTIDGDALGLRYHQHAERFHRRERWAGEYLSFLTAEKSK
jgi:colanic acid biosynthesis glycosyl transferase WcaI